MFNHSRKVVRLVAEHGADDCEFVDDTADIRKPVRDGNTGLTVALKGPENWNHRALHRSVVVAKTDSIHHRSGELVVFGVESINMTDAAAHEQVDHRLRAGL